MAQKHMQKVFVKKTVADSIRVLLSEAEKNAIRHPERTKRYMEMLWNLVMKHKIRLTKEQKQSFCRKCRAFFVPEQNVRIIFNSRTNSFYLVCKTCGNKRRMGRA